MRRGGLPTGADAWRVTTACKTSPKQECLMIVTMDLKKKKAPNVLNKSFRIIETFFCGLNEAHQWSLIRASTQYRQGFPCKMYAHLEYNDKGSVDLRAVFPFIYQLSAVKVCTRFWGHPVFAPLMVAEVRRLRRAAGCAVI